MSLISTNKLLLHLLLLLTIFKNWSFGARHVVCKRTRENSRKTETFHYHNEKYECLQCSEDITALVPRSHFKHKTCKNICKSKCNGLLCSNESHSNYICVELEKPKICFLKKGPDPCKGKCKFVF